MIEYSDVVLTWPWQLEHDQWCEGSVEPCLSETVISGEDHIRWSGQRYHESTPIRER